MHQTRVLRTLDSQTAARFARGLCMALAIATEQRLMPVHRLSLVIATLISACVSQPDATRVGPNSFQVSASEASARSGNTSARELALKKAAKYCKWLGEEVKVTNIQSEPASSNVIAIVSFECVTDKMAW